MDKSKIKQKQKQTVNVVVNVAHPKLRRKSKRRVRAPRKPETSSLISSFQQPLVRMIRYDVPAPVAQPIASKNYSGIAQPPEVSAGKLIVDTPLEVRGSTPATDENLAAPFRFDPGPTIKLNKDGTPRKPRGPNKPKIIATVVEDAVVEDVVLEDTPRFEGLGGIAKLVARQRAKLRANNQYYEE